MFQPQVLTVEEIRALLTDFTEEEVEQARALSLTPIEARNPLRGRPGQRHCAGYGGTGVH